MFFRARILLWPVALGALLLAGALIAATAFGAFAALSLPSVFGTSTETRSTQVIKSLEREQQVVVLRLGIVGVDDEKQVGNVLGVDIAGTERAVFLRYEFDAKLGFDGKDVTFTLKGEDTIVVSIPKFIFIGYDNWESEVAAEANGLLSWTTPGIDSLAMSNSIIDDEAKVQYVEDYEYLLKDQAQVFYGEIVSSVDPDITLEFVFRD